MNTLFLSFFNFIFIFRRHEEDERIYNGNKQPLLTDSTVHYNHERVTCS